MPGLGGSQAEIAGSTFGKITIPQGEIARSEHLRAAVLRTTGSMVCPRNRRRSMSRVLGIGLALLLVVSAAEAQSGAARPVRLLAEGEDFTPEQGEWDVVP